MMSAIVRLPELKIPEGKGNFQGVESSRTGFMIVEIRKLSKPVD